jgi:hypothetical protein
MLSCSQLARDRIAVEMFVLDLPSHGWQVPFPCKLYGYLVLLAEFRLQLPVFVSRVLFFYTRYCRRHPGRLREL